MKKYELTDNIKVIGNSKLYRIRALRDFRDVKAGDLGGYIEKEDNLSHYGNCWVYDTACVFGDAQVYGSATIHNNAQAFDHAMVSGEAEVSDSACVYDNAKVSDSACVFGDALVFGDAQVFGDARVYGCDTVSNNNQAQQEVTPLKFKMLDELQVINESKYDLDIKIVNNKVYIFRK